MIRLVLSDIDECSVLSNPCGKNAICENAVPGYNCLCPVGYEAQPTPEIACEQVDVATLCKSNFDCINNAECIDGQCFCRDGFVAKGAACVDVDECAANPCGPFSVCANTAGSHKCECEAGFVGKPPLTPCKGTKRFRIPAAVHAIYRLLCTLKQLTANTQALNLTNRLCT